MRRLLLALAAAALLALTLAPAALATTTRTETWGTEQVIYVYDPGAVAVDGTTFSLRGMHDLATVTGSVSGMQEGWVNYDIDVVTFEGELWGTSYLVPAGVTDGGMACTWHGTFTKGTYGAAWTGKSVCHGDGSLTGLQSRSDVTSVPGGSTFVGYSFTPGT